jgi:hypothetical protein
MRVQIYILSIAVFLAAGICAASEQLVADELFPYIDMEASPLAGVKQKYQAGQYADALDEYKDIFLDRIAMLNLSDMPGSSSNADDLLADNIVRIYNQQGGYEVQGIGEPGQIDWYLVTDYASWEYSLSNMHWASALIDRYGQSPSVNGQYLEKWVQYWCDFSLNNYDQWNAIRGTSAEDDYGDGFRLIWTHRLILGDRIRYLLAQLSAAMDAEPAVTKSLITGEQFGIIINEMAQRNMNQLNDTIHGGVPNQVITSALSLMQAGLSFVAFTDAPTWQATGEYETQNYLQASYMPDGTDMEQSFNYNGMMIDVGRQTVDLYQSTGGDQPVWISDYQNAMLKRFRFLSSIVRPNGMLPSLDLQSDTDAYSRLSGYQDYFNDPLTAQIIDHTWNSYPSLSAPAFESIYFPYGGYCIFRSGWDGGAHHMFMKNSRMGKGHYDQSSNQLQITAFGRTMLIDSGGSLYAPDYRNDYFHGSFAHNTIVVDGKSQVMGGEFYPAYNTTIDARFYTSDDFDYIEGTFGAGADGGYGSDGNIEITDVTHNREVNFIKDIGVYVIVDRMLSGGSHTYTQIWNFDKTYQKEDVTLAAINKIKTVENYQPNVAIYNFSPVTLSYTRYYGFYDGANVYGWAKQDAGFIQAVDTHRSWSGSGDQLLLTLVVPTQRLDEHVSVTSDYADNDIIQFSAVADDGSVIDFAARKSAGAITIGGITATAKSLLVVTDLQGVSNATTLGCTSLSIDSVGQSLSSADLRMTIENGVITQKEDITSPSDFNWTGSGENITVAYEEVPATVTLSASPTYVDTLDPAAGEIEVYSGTEVSLSAGDYLQCPYVEKFSHWQVNGNYYSGEKDITITAEYDMTVTAIFEDDRQCGDICHPISAADFNRDCYVNLEDTAILIENWLSNTNTD